MKIIMAFAFGIGMCCFGPISGCLGILFVLMALSQAESDEKATREGNARRAAERRRNS